METNRKYLFAVFIILTLIFTMTACSVQKISDVKTPENVGKTVRVSGTVGLTVKIGSLSGYALKDDTGTISVSSQELPKEGDTIIISGVLMKDTILGYYIKTG